MSQNLADVVATGVEDGEDGVADGAFRVASGQAAIGHVANYSLDRAAPAKVYELFRSQPSACAADQDTGLPFVMPPNNRDQRSASAGRSSVRISTWPSASLYRPSENLLMLQRRR